MPRPDRPRLAGPRDLLAMGYPSTHRGYKRRLGVHESTRLSTEVLREIRRSCHRNRRPNQHPLVLSTYVATVVADVLRRLRNRYPRGVW